jgi:DNA-binding LytR/AlgR family response regulator
MSTLKIGIVEDEMIIAEALSEILKSIGYEIPEPASNYDEAIVLLEQEKPDLMLLDINLSSHLSGIDLALTINEKFQIPFIFLTANTDTVTLDQAKKVRPMAYLAKPITRDQLYSSIEIAIHNFNASKQTSSSSPSTDNTLFIKDGYTFRKIDFTEITHLESDSNYVIVHLLNGSKLLSRSTMTTFLEQLPSTIFLRIHRSFAVNKFHIESIHTTEVLTLNKKTLPLGKNYKDSFLNTLGVNDN